MSTEPGAAAPATEQAQAAPAVTETATPATSVPNAEAAPENAGPEGQETEQAAPEGDDSPEPKKLTRNQRLQRQKARLATVVADQAAEIERLRQTTEKSAKESEPKEADYNGDWTKYSADYAAWKATQNIRGVLEERDQQARTTQLNERIQEATEEFLERVEQIKPHIGDFDEVMNTFEKTGGKFAHHVIEEIRDSEKGPMLAYQIAKTPGLAAELNALSPRDAAREIGRIEAKLVLPKPRTQTQAPTPLTSLKGGASAAKDPKEMSMPEYIAWRKGQSK